MSMLSKSLLCFLVLGGVVPDAGGENWLLSRKPQVCLPNCVGKLQPDDYCSKCPPDAHGPRCFACDDYDCKCPPGVTRLAQFRCDDYCRKPFKLSCAPSISFGALPSVSPTISRWNPLGRVAAGGDVEKVEAAAERKRNSPANREALKR